MTALRWYTFQKELVENNGPDLWGFGGWGEIGAVLCLGGQRGPDCIVDTISTALNFRKPNKFLVNDASGPRPGLTHNYLKRTEP
jgi:hypothetical protein